MGHSTIVLLGSLVAVALVLVFTALHWQRMRSLRVALQGAGVALFLAGLYVLGFMDLVYAWVRDTWHWVLHTTFHGEHMAGLVIGGAGVLLFLVGMLVSPVSRAEAKQRRQLRQQQPAEVGPASRGRGGAQAQPAGRPGAAKGAPAQAANARGAAKGRPASGLDPEDAEIEAILRGHGIE